MNAIENELEWQNAWYLVEREARAKALTPRQFARVCIQAINHEMPGLRQAVGVIRSASRLLYINEELALAHELEDILRNLEEEQATK